MRRAIAGLEQQTEVGSALGFRASTPLAGERNPRTANIIVTTLMLSVCTPVPTSTDSIIGARGGRKTGGQRRSAMMALPSDKAAQQRRCGRASSFYPHAPATVAVDELPAGLLLDVVCRLDCVVAVEVCSARETRPAGVGERCATKEERARGLCLRARVCGGGKGISHRGGACAS